MSTQVGRSIKLEVLSSEWEAVATFDDVLDDEDWLDGDVEDEM